MRKKTAIIQVRLDKQTKKEAQEIAEELGLSLSDVVQIKLRTFVRERAISAYAPLRPSKKLEKILIQADKDIRSGKNLSPVFDTLDKAIDWLEKDKKR